MTNNISTQDSKTIVRLNETDFADDDLENTVYVLYNNEGWVISFNDLLRAMNEGRKTYRAEDQCNCELKKEYISESGMKIKRYCIRKTAEEQKAFEELATRRTWEIVSKYVK